MNDSPPDPISRPEGMAKVNSLNKNIVGRSPDVCFRIYLTVGARGLGLKLQSRTYGRCVALAGVGQPRRRSSFLPVRSLYMSGFNYRRGSLKNLFGTALC
jgi:hypothetical protein